MSPFNIITVNTDGWEWPWPPEHDTDPDPVLPPPAATPVPLRCRCGVLRDTLVPWPTNNTDGRRMCTSCGWQGTP